MFYTFAFTLPPSLFAGFSHNSDYKLFELGEVSSESVKEFAETGETVKFDQVGEEEEAKLLDWFTAPPIDKGSGQSEAKLFVDGNHTLVRQTGRLIGCSYTFQRQMKENADVSLRKSSLLGLCNVRERRGAIRSHLSPAWLCKK